MDLFNKYKEQIKDEFSTFEIQRLQARAYYQLKDFEKAEKAFVLLYDFINADFVNILKTNRKEEDSLSSDEFFF